MAAGRKNPGSLSHAVTTADHSSRDGKRTRKASMAGDQKVTKSRPWSSLMLPWKTRPLRPKASERNSDVGARMNPVSKSTAPVASSVSSHGILSSACCSARTLGPAGRDHIES